MAHEAKKGHLVTTRRALLIIHHKTGLQTCHEYRIQTRSETFSQEPSQQTSANNMLWRGDTQMFAFMENADIIFVRAGRGLVVNSRLRLLKLDNHEQLYNFLPSIQLQNLYGGNVVVFFRRKM